MQASPEIETENTLNDLQKSAKYGIEGDPVYPGAPFIGPDKTIGVTEDVHPVYLTVLRTPPTPDTARRDFVALYAPVDIPQTSLYRVSSAGLFIFRNMPTLLPRKIPRTASVSQVRGFGLPHLSTGSASSLQFNEATCGFTCVTACCFANWKLTTPCYQDAAPLNYRGESDNPPDGTLTRKIKQLLLRTDSAPILRPP